MKLLCVSVLISTLITGSKSATLQKSNTFLRLPFQNDSQAPSHQEHIWYRSAALRNGPDPHGPINLTSLDLWTEMRNAVDLGTQFYGSNYTFCTTRYNHSNTFDPETAYQGNYCNSTIFCHEGMSINLFNYRQKRRKDPITPSLDVRLNCLDIMYIAKRLLLAELGGPGADPVKHSTLSNPPSDILLLGKSKWTGDKSWHVGLHMIRSGVCPGVEQTSAWTSRTDEWGNVVYL